MAISLAIFVIIAIAFAFGDSSTCPLIGRMRKILLIVCLFCICLRLFVELPLIVMKWTIKKLDCIYKTLFCI